MKNNCHTYFLITGDFEPSEISEMLGLSPEESHGVNDMRRDGEPYGFASWMHGFCGEYDVYVESQMRKTIEPFADKIAILKEIKEKFKVDFTLEVVPEVCAEESTPCLAPPLDVMRFCCETGTEMDIDLYVMGDGEYEDQQ